MSKKNKRNYIRFIAETSSVDKGLSKIVDCYHDLKKYPFINQVIISFKDFLISLGFPIKDLAIKTYNPVPNMSNTSNVPRTENEENVDNFDYEDNEEEELDEEIEAEIEEAVNKDLDKFLRDVNGSRDFAKDVFKVYLHTLMY